MRLHLTWCNFGSKVWMSRNALLLEVNHSVYQCLIFNINIALINSQNITGLIGARGLNWWVKFGILCSSFNSKLIQGRDRINWNVTSGHKTVWVTLNLRCNSVKTIPQMTFLYDLIPQLFMLFLPQNHTECHRNQSGGVLPACKHAMRNWNSKL